MSSSELEKALGSNPSPTTKPANNSATDGLQLLQRLNTQFRSWQPSEFVEFIRANSDLTDRLIPVSLPKKVPIVPRGTKLDDCRLTPDSLAILANNLGRPGIYPGIGPKGSSPITAHGIALRARMRGVFRTVHIDIDADFFGGAVDQRLVDWVEAIDPYALKTRGNRQRLTLFIGITDELQDYFLDEYDVQYTDDGKVRYRATSKIQYRLKDYKNGEEDGNVEIVIGSNNNTMFGFHPSGSQYQQVGPEDNVLGALDIDDFQELLAILDEISYSPYLNRGLAGDRITLLEGWEDIDPILSMVRLKDQIDKSFAIPVERQGVTLKISDYLGEKTKRIIAGELYRDKNHYYESNPSQEFSIREHYRHSTYRHVGQDVEQIKALFVEAGIRYDKNEIPQILETLWDLTDTVGSGVTGSDYTFSEAEDSFNGGQYATYKKMYFTSLCADIFADIRIANEELVAQLANDEISSPVSKELNNAATKGKEHLDTHIREQIEVENDRASQRLKETIHNPVTGNAPVDNPYDVSGAVKSAEDTNESQADLSQPASSVEDIDDVLSDLSSNSAENNSTLDPSQNPFLALIASGKAQPITGAIDIDNLPPDFYTASDNGIDKDDDLDEIQRKLESYKKKGSRFNNDDSYAPSVLDITDDDTLDLVEEINLQEAKLRELVFADEKDIIPESIRDHVVQSLDHQLTGYTFPFMVHASVMLVSCARSLEVVNLDANDRKYKTPIAPYGLTVTKSGQGKTLVSNLVAPLGNLFNSHFSKISGKEVVAFKNAYVSSNALLDADKLQKKLDNDEGEDAFDNDDLAARIEELTALEQILREKKPAEILNATVARTLGNSTEAGLRMMFALQQTKKDIRRATKGKFFNDAYTFPLTVYNDELGALITDLFSGSKNNFAGDTQMYCGLKEGHMVATARVTSGLTISDSTSISLGGNMTTKKFVDVLKVELQGTDGFFPRVNLSAMSKKPVEPIDINRPQVWDRDYDSTDYVTYNLMGAGLVSHYLSSQIYKGGCELHPLHTGTIRLSEEAQRVMYSAMNRADLEKKRIQGKFYNYTDFIESTLNKQPREMAIYAGSLWLLDNSLEYFNRLQSVISSGIYSEVEQLDVKSLMALALSSEHHERERFINLIKTAMVYAGPDLEATSVGFDREISKEILQRAESIFFRSVHTFEYFLHQLEKTNATDLQSRAKEARNKKTLREFDPSSFDTEAQLNDFAEALIRRVGTNGTKKHMTLAQVGRQTRAMRKIYDENKSRLDDIIKVLYRGNVLVDLDNKTKINSTTFRLNPDIQISEIQEKVSMIAKTIADSSSPVLVSPEG